MNVIYDAEHERRVLVNAYVAESAHYRYPLLALFVAVHWVISHCVSKLTSSLRLLPQAELRRAHVALLGLQL